MHSDLKKSDDPITSDEVIVVAEHVDGVVRPVTYELITFAKQLAEMLRLSVRVFIAGHDPQPLALEISNKTGLDVVAVLVSGLTHYNSSIYKSLYSSALAEIKPRFICIAHTSQGLDFAPGLAIRINSACITGVHGIYKNNTGVVFSRFICSGKINAQIKSVTETSLITVQAGFFLPDVYDGLPGNVQVKTHVYESEEVQPKGLIKSDSGVSAISRARIVVAAGRGIGDKENIKAIERFSEYFPGSAVGGSRPLIDMGWMEYKHQVGITGTTVAPDIYIAFGISGSSQHVAGMRSSGYVISINSDSNASIFNVSDLCIVEDVLSFIEVFEKVLSY